MCKWSLFKTKKKIGQDVWMFKCSNYYIGVFLEGMDYHKKSYSSACKILSKIPDHLKHYWWRGYFDGDGCFYIPKGKKIKSGCSIKITSSYAQDWSFIEDLNKRVGITLNICKRIRKDNNRRFSEVSTSGQINCLLLSNFFYKDYDLFAIGLKRKYIKFVMLIKNIKKLINVPNARDQYWKRPNLRLVELVNNWSKKMNIIR